MQPQQAAWCAALALFLGAAVPGNAQQAPPDVDGTPPAPAANAEAPAPAPPAFGGSLLERTRLTGDWVGCRTSLAECGITFDAAGTQYYQGVVSGGRQQEFAYDGHADYFLDVDGQKAGLWQGLFINLHAETVYGNSVNPATGSLIPVNTARLFPTPDGTVTALTALKFTQALSENFAVFAGKINLFDGFQQPFLPGKGLDNGFMNLANIVNPVLGRTVPYSTLGAGAVVLVGGQPAATFMVIDTHNTPTTTGFPTLFDNGVTLVAQAGLPSHFFGMPGHHILLGTYSSGSYAETDVDAYTLINRFVQGVPLLNRVSGSWCLVYSFDQAMWIDPCNSKRSWGLWGNIGLSDGNPNPLRWGGTVGVAGSSPIANRKLDTFGLGYYYTGLAESFKNIAPALLPLRDEQGVEVFYNIGLTPWCHLTPDLQVVVPSRDRVDASVVIGLRAKIDF